MIKHLQTAVNKFIRLIFGLNGRDSQWRGNVFWTGGAQNSKIVSTSGGRSPPDPPFFRTHVFESRTLSRPILIDINCMPA